MSETPDYDEYASANASGDAQLTPSDTLTGDDRLDPLDAGYSPPDREPRAVRFGVTADEERRGESLDDLLAEEEPDISDAEVDEDFDYDDADPTGSTGERGGASAEEEAIHIEEG